MLYLGRSFGLEVIAEAIETKEQLARLRKKGREEEVLVRRADGRDRVLAAAQFEWR